LLTGVVAGLVPALKASSPDLVPDLKGEITAGRVAGRRLTLRDALAAGQIAVTLLLLVSAGLLVRSLGAAEAADVGFRSDGLALVGLDMEMAGYDAERTAQFFEEADRRLRTIPGVTAAARASRLPFSLNFNQSNIAVPGHQQAPDEMGPAIDTAEVSPTYFETLGIPLLEGRGFVDADGPGTPRVAIVNETMAKRFWPGESAIGRVMYARTLSSGQPIEIVGVAADHRMRTVGEGAVPAFYTSTTQRPSSYGVLVARTSGDEVALLAEMRRTLLAMEPDALFIDNQTMKEQMAGVLFPVRAAAILVAIFGGLGLLLAAVGLYGVIASGVERRTREIGIRMAIGARHGDVLSLVVRQGAVIAVCGLGAGVLLAAGATQVVAGALYDVGVADPLAWGGAATVLLTVTALANVVPALRAMRVNPVQALRTD
jgi:predicted permease